MTSDINDETFAFIVKKMLFMNQCEKDIKDQESLQSSTKPVRGYQVKIFHWRAKTGFTRHLTLSSDVDQGT